MVRKGRPPLAPSGKPIDRPPHYRLGLQHRPGVFIKSELSVRTMASISELHRAYLAHLLNEWKARETNLWQNRKRKHGANPPKEITSKKRVPGAPTYLSFARYINRLVHLKLVEEVLLDDGTPLEYPPDARNWATPPPIKQKRFYRLTPTGASSILEWENPRKYL